MISLEEIDQVIQSGPFEPTWDSLSHQEIGRASCRERV